jgi:hypothetical protein
METLEPRSLYLASWEHLYFLADGRPAGLPSEIFSRHPWALVLFERLHCDKNGLDGERNAAERMGWVNSQLFVELQNRGIVQPLPSMKETLKSIPTVLAKYKARSGLTVENAIHNGAISEDELFNLRSQALVPFLSTNRLILYDYAVSPTPVLQLNEVFSQALRISPVLNVNPVDIPLSKQISELSPDNLRLFRELQAYEGPKLRLLRSGQIQQPEYLDFLELRKSDHQKIDQELGNGLQTRLETLLRIRDAFEQMGGWNAVREYLHAYDVIENRIAIVEPRNRLVELIRKAFTPVAGDYPKTDANILKGHMGSLGEGIPRAPDAEELPLKDERPSSPRSSGSNTTGFDFLNGPPHQGGPKDPSPN